MKHLLLSFCALSLLGNLSCADEAAIPTLAAPGTLQIYRKETQNGTIARRIFKDTSGRSIRAVYYRKKAFVQSPKDESDLVPYEIHLDTYDEGGRPEWMGVYSPELILQRSLETTYGEAGRIRMRQWRDADGIVRYQMRDGSHIYYDDTGTRVIKVQGKIPAGIDPKTIKIIK